MFPVFCVQCCLSGSALGSPFRELLIEIRLLGDSFLVCSGSAFIYILRATKKHQLIPWGLGAPAVRTGNNRWGVAPDGGLQSAQWWAVDWMVERGSQRACDGHSAGTWSR